MREEQQNAISMQLVKAQKLLPTVDKSRDIRINISRICSEVNVDGLRGDIVVNRAAKALAALNGR